MNQTYFIMPRLLAVAALAAANAVAAGASSNAILPGPVGVLLLTHSSHGIVPVRSWKHLRDDRIVKQDLDYSCGAASLATLLDSYYGQAITEEQLLKAMDKTDGRASFEDMTNALAQFGFKAQGFAASFDQLARLRMPVIVYMKHRKDDHFSVLRGINGDTVWLADPSLGNRTFSRTQFESMWNVRGEALSGKFLAVLPIDPETTAANTFFSKAPRRQTANTVKQLTIHPIP
ncbi:C39 family peptidase [Achromobacter xylosoxidans]|uniref:C39 family peptidase n=1 Tax=Alcaligenes xylosoxydans xylosoxydans TaxID=85698 RepID=UPI001E58E43C|nr:C39 family peptidase [Achromobacter xylosoxidans]